MQILPRLTYASLSIALASTSSATPSATEMNTDFAIRLYAQLAKEQPGENLFFSPFSISNALAMAAEGAHGTTTLEMGQVLGMPCLLYTSPSPRDKRQSRMPSSA